MAEGGSWNESLCGCCDDCNTCCYGCWCTPCLFGENAEKINGDECWLWCGAYWCLSSVSLCWIPHFFKRQELRTKYGLKADKEISDLLTTCFCSPCAVCQEARFLKRTGGQPRVMTGVVPQTYQPGASYRL